MTDLTKGTLAIISACVIWGLSPIYYKLLVHVPATDLMAHRTIWSLVLFSALLAFRGRLNEVPQAFLLPGGWWRITLAAIFVSFNWFLFIYSVQIDRVTETSLGYYIFPLVAVVLGRVVFGDKLGSWQWASVFLAAGAVALLVVGAGVMPWISIVLATTFGAYSVIKKRLTVGPTVSVTAEVALIAIPALVHLVWVYRAPGVLADLTGLDWGLLVFSGVLTAFPLILFSYAAQRVSMSSIGVIQYLNPTLQFLCAVVLFGEPFGGYQAASFGLIWCALAIYSVSATRQENARRKASRVASASAGASMKSASDASANP